MENPDNPNPNQLIFDLKYSIKYSEFLENLLSFYDESKDKDSYFLTHLYEVLSKFKILDRPLISSDISQLGRLSLYSLIAHLNKSDTTYLTKKFKHNQKNKIIIDHLKNTKLQHYEDLNNDCHLCAKSLHLKAISMAPTIPIIGNTVDNELHENLFNFFNEYEENYHKALVNEKMNIEVFVRKNQKRKKPTKTSKSGSTNKTKRNKTFENANALLNYQSKLQKRSKRTF